MSTNIGQIIYDLFGDNGDLGVLLCIFLIFLLDALLVPTLPELFFILGFMAGAEHNTPIVFGCELLLVAILAELVGILSLYYVVKHIRIPKKIEKLVDTYTKFLVMGDERLLLLNRIAPMIPFAGAFIAIAKWDLKKSMFYIVLGCVLKYGIIMLLSNMFLDFFNSDQAQLFMIIMIVVVIAVSMIMSFVIKKRHGLDEKQPPENED
ncbi:hypothetical protein MMALV_00770 [Candidatus Methanomethylophilus alvi Mx1201]|uniref:DedA family protein n=2 Tax=Methanomethylophilus alvi TaxID=1291540 RepID=M9SAI7_METAX|nr:hypothetical protein [Methanomethylophilus alvi]AGI84834.1 hypothetical protein MMALV_00770 [Candidatus Methanomethylophilus alvi Mx1201]AYQ54272.1 hypothetical protein BKD89_00355 [Methanomethylophilus alvi]CDF30591.1 unknown [Methanoculleus sp. CAG:1088]